MTAVEYLKILDNPVGPSGYEGGVAEVVKELFSKYCDEAYIDKMGNAVGIRKGTNKNAPSIMIEAHIDELGLMVSKITQQGSLKFVALGGFDPKVLVGCEVTVYGREKLFGVIGAVPPHIARDGGKALKMSDLCVDIGFSREETQRLVAAGDVITVNTSFTELKSGAVAGRCIDDRAGIAAIVKMLEMLKNESIENDIYVVGAVQEEVGSRGAITSVNAIKPKYAVAIDVCHGTSPDVSDEAFDIGSGPVLSVGPNLHTGFTREIMNIAKNNGIEYNIEVCGGDTGTDAWELQTAAGGIPTALISIPLRYMHANYEVAHSSDLESAAKLIGFVAKELKDGDMICC